MADQHKWFKLWVTAPGDDGLQQLPPELRWAWCVLGCYTKQHGTDGAVEISPSNAALAAAMCVKPSHLREVIERLPHVTISNGEMHTQSDAQLCAHDARGEGQNRHGTFTVTWRNWRKYQEDSTAAKRQASRRKRRGEENRGDKNRKDSPPYPPFESYPQGSDGGQGHPPARSAARVRKASTSGGPEPVGGSVREFMASLRAVSNPAPADVPPRGEVEI